MIPESLSGVELCPVHLEVKRRRTLGIKPEQMGLGLLPFFRAHRVDVR